MNTRWVIKNIRTNARHPGYIYAELHDMEQPEGQRIMVGATLGYCFEAARVRGAKAVLIEDIDSISPECLKYLYEALN